MSKSLAVFDPFPIEATSVEAAAWVRQLVRLIGAGFHPDHCFDEYVRGDGTRLFSWAECGTLAMGLNRTWAILDRAGIDLYGVALPVQRRLLRASGLR